MGPRSTNPYALPDGVAPDRAVCPHCHPGRVILQFDHVAAVVDAKTRCKRISTAVKTTGMALAAVDRAI